MNNTFKKVIRNSVPIQYCFILEKILFERPSSLHPLSTIKRNIMPNIEVKRMRISMF